MKKIMLLGLLVMAVLAAAGDADAFRCGSKLVKVGDSKGDILRRCGAPTWRDSWQEERIERVFGAPYSLGGKSWVTRVPVAAVVTVTLEEWTYNLGSSQFMRILRFENNKLVNIETGDYGY